MKKTNAWVKKATDKINSSTVIHDTYAKTRMRLFSNTLVHLPEGCQMIVGPSRIGKTRISKEFEAELNPKNESQFVRFRPVVRLTCRNRGDKGSFTTKGFLFDALATLEHPFYTLTDHGLGLDSETIRRRDRSTTTTLQAVFENALITLKTKYLIIDETQHLRYSVGGEQSTLQMLEYFKTLAERLHMTLIFVGAYPMLNVLELSPHMLGRLSIIEMPRYRIESESSLAKFHEILDWYSEGIQFEKNTDSLLDWNRELYDGSLGVIGLLSLWLRDAMSLMLANEDNKLTLDHLMEVRKPQHFLNKMASEIIEGENYLRGGGEEKPKKVRGDFIKKKKPSNNTVNNKIPFQTKVARRAKGGRS